MKAKPISILTDIENDRDYVVGHKFNGYSEILVVKGGSIRMFNKSGTEQTESVPHITGVRPPDSMDLVVVGEGHAPSDTVWDAKSIFGSGPAYSISWQQKHGLAAYAAVSITRYKGEDVTHVPFGERLGALTDAVQQLRELGVGCISQERLIMNGKADYFVSTVAQGGEGVVVKKLSGFEKDWFKVKKFKTWDVVVTGFTSAQYGKTGKFAGLIGAIQYGMYNLNGKLVEIGKCSGMTDAQRVAFSSARESYIGRVIEVKGQEFGSRGGIIFPRFVRIRDDKLPTDCVLEYAAKAVREEVL